MRADRKPDRRGLDVRAWLQRAEREPWRHELLALLRRLCAADPGAARLGEARSPRRERIRLGQRPSLAFAPREIASIEPSADGVRVFAYGLGMLGPNGGLPLHYTELVRERLHAARDSALADFLDLFHHRAMGLFYRAWAQAGATTGLDRRDDERFTRYVACLVGDVPLRSDCAWPGHARWASAAQRLRRMRASQGLCSALQDYLCVPASIDEFQLQWLEIHAAERSRLGADDRGARLGDAAVLGERVADRQGCFRIQLGPLNLAQYLDLLPRRDAPSSLRALQACVLAFVGRDYRWRLRLVLPAAQTRCAILGGVDTLARSAWLGDARAAADVDGMVSVVFDGAFLEGRDGRGASI